MKATKYAGLDYSRGLSNTDQSNGIRYGVISQNTVAPDALNDFYSDGEDLAWKEALKEALESARNEAKENKDSEDIDEDRISDDLGNCWESSAGNLLYEQDGYKLTGCLDDDLFVLKSPFFTYAQFCSPCVPGAGDLDNPFESEMNQAGLKGEGYAKEASEAGFPRVYCLGHDWFETGAPYAVYSVKTGKCITLGENPEGE